MPNLRRSDRLQKCFFEVNTNPYRCLHRLGLTADQIMNAIKKKMPPLKSQYTALKPVVKDDGRHEMELSKEAGVCILGKEFTMGDGRLADEFDYQTVKNTDRVYKIAPSGASFQLEERYTLLTRMVADRNATEKVEMTEDEKRRYITLLQSVAGKTIEYPLERFAKVMTFGEVIPEENVPSHIIEYFYTCPCEATDFSKTKEYEKLSTKRVTDYYVD